MNSEIATKADFSQIRYAQCWEDADILLNALDIQPGHVCLSIASAGDNTLAMLSKGAKRVIALDLNLAQLACLELRVAAYRTLTHPELLALIGSRHSDHRLALYERCRKHLSSETCRFWDARPQDIANGIGGAGKFERFLDLFRRRVLPLIHTTSSIDHLLKGGSEMDRQMYYANHWNSWRWRLLFRLFFSRTLISYLGRDPRFFDYVEGAVADRILARTRYALTTLNPAENPYLQWILTGHHSLVLPYALRPENFVAIRDNLDRLEWHAASLEDYLDAHPDVVIDRFNLSDIFEYMSAENYHTLLLRLTQASQEGSRLAYWNMLVPRSRPAHLADILRPLKGLAQDLYRLDKAFFYRDFIVEEVMT
ncbi:MAG: DUF3419 family protein [Chloroflexota bacterium]